VAGPGEPAGEAGAGFVVALEQPAAIAVAAINATATRREPA
jgi:hypothetical protein